MKKSISHPHPSLPPLRGKGSDTIYLQHALKLAEIRRGFCAPNPAVGAVVVKDDVVLATGFHRASGLPHAEVEALNKIGAEAEGATLYVTLEPCCHHGKTPPCTDLIIQRKIARVVYGQRDPNPQVAGRSEKILSAAGIICSHLELNAITAFYKSYCYWWQTGKPWITAKLAISLDGKIAGKNGARITITGNAAQQFTHQQRKAADAILTTAKTILADDPLLNVRLTDENYKKPLYILDSDLTTPINAKVFTNTECVTMLHSASAPAEQLKLFKNQNVRCELIKKDNNGLSLVDIVTHIGKNGVHDLWIEAGGTCFSAFIQAQLVQKALLYVAPKWLGEAAKTALVSSNDIFANARSYQWSSLDEDAVCAILW